MEKIRYGINSELPRTGTNSEFVRVSISSLLSSIFSISFAKLVNPAHPRRRTRMTQITRIFTDPCASVSSAQSAFCRLISLLIINEREKNPELKRTKTNSDSVSSYGFRTSSLLIFIQHRGHIEMQQTSVLSVSSVVDNPCTPTSIMVQTCLNSFNNYIHQS